MLILACFSITKPGKHFLIETDDTPEEGGSDKSKDYARRGPFICYVITDTHVHRRPCILLVHFFPVDREKKDCEANAQWKEGCKSCTCQPDGREVVCDDLECRDGNSNDYARKPL